MAESPRDPAQPSSPLSPGRRSLLDLLLAGGLLGWLGTVVYPVLRYLSPLRESERADEAVLGDKAKQDLLDSGFAIVALGTERVLVLRDSKGQLRATSAKCTHEGCTVRYKADEGIIWCACHNGRFDLGGRVLSGPPPRPLVAYKTSGSLDTKVVISREEGASA
jgi:cytochrome b6-f complex iron-sulfur subunit